MNGFLAQLNLSREEAVFVARIEDCCEICDKNNIAKFTGFLDLRQQKIAQYACCSSSVYSVMLYGGHEGAERKMFGVFPDYIYDKENSFPIDYICIKHKMPINHRDILGSLMSLGIKRDIVGDIIVGEQKSFIYIQNSMSQHIIDNVSKIANVGVTLEMCSADDVVFDKERFEENSVIVSSMRLDCIVAALGSKSRADASKLIASERVSVNHEVVSSCSKPVCEGDVLSIRSVGKFIIGSCASKTKKGRLVLLYKKYI